MTTFSQYARAFEISDGLERKAESGERLNSEESEKLRILGPATTRYFEDLRRALPTTDTSEVVRLVGERPGRGDKWKWDNQAIKMLAAEAVGVIRLEEFPTRGLLYIWCVANAEHTEFPSLLTALSGSLDGHASVELAETELDIAAERQIAENVQRLDGLRRDAPGN